MYLIVNTSNYWFNDQTYQRYLCQNHLFVVKLKNSFRRKIKKILAK